MKICRILKGYWPFPLGGADIYAGKISQELAKQGNEEVVISINPTKGDSIENFGKVKIYRFYPFNVSTFHSIGKESIIKKGMWTLLDIYSLYSYKKIKTILKKENPNVVHLHTPVDVTLSAVHAVKSLGLPLVYTLHDYFLMCRRFTLLHGNGKMCTERNLNPLCKFYRTTTKEIVKNVDIIIAPSQFVLDIHTKHGFFKNSKTIVLPHGIEIDNFGNYNKTNKTNDSKIINLLYVGSLTKHKGVHILIDAIKKIKDDNLKLNIIGSGVYENKLKQLANNDRRICFYGNVPNNEVKKFYEISDLVIVPSIWYDVRPNVIVEAFRAGLPVIGSNIGGIPELIKYNYNGFLFEPGNTEHLKVILEKNIIKRDVLRELGKNAQQFVKQFEMAEYIKKLYKIYEEVIDLNKKRTE